MSVENPEPTAFLSLPEQGQDIVDVARTHAQMSAEILWGYDNWCRLTLGRYALETVSLDELQKEHDEQIRLHDFILEATDILPPTTGNKLYTTDKLEADKFISSIYRYDGGLYYPIGLDATQLYLAKPRDVVAIAVGSPETAGETDTTTHSDGTEGGTPSGVFSVRTSTLEYKTFSKLKKQMNVLIDGDSAKLLISDDDIRRMYDPFKKVLNVGNSVPYIRCNSNYNNGYLKPDRIATFPGESMNVAGIFQRLLLLSVRFDVYEQHVQLLEQLSQDVMVIRETPPEERERMQASIQQMFAVAEEHRQTHQMDAAEAANGKRKGLFARRAK